MFKRVLAIATLALALTACVPAGGIPGTGFMGTFGQPTGDHPSRVGAVITRAGVGRRLDLHPRSRLRLRLGRPGRGADAYGHPRLNGFSPLPSTVMVRAPNSLGPRWPTNSCSRLTQV